MSVESDVFTEYAVINARIKDLISLKEQLRETILEDMAKNKVEFQETASGRFSISKLKSWKYSSKVERANEELKAMKAMEESTGDASYEEKPSLRFTPVKF